MLEREQIKTYLNSVTSTTEKGSQEVLI